MLRGMAWVRLVLACALVAGACAERLTTAQPGAPTEVEPAPAAAAPVEGDAPVELPTYEGVPWPIVPTPIASPRPAPPAPIDPPAEPATAAAARVVGIVDGIRTSLTESTYQHSTEVHADTGVYLWDCSGMTTWILRRAAPKAVRALKSSRPVARDYARVIEHAPVDRARSSWMRVDHIADVRPGDVFAWRRPRGLPSKNTGHVGIVVDQPVEVPGVPGAWAVRIADSTSNGHQDDSRAGDPDGGFGIGTIVFLADADGHGTHYGWGGTYSDWFVITSIVFGRVSG